MYHRFIFLHKIEKIIFCKYVELPCFPCIKGIQARQSWILYSMARIPGSICWMPVFFSVELGFWISIISGFLDSLSRIPDSMVQDSGSNKHKFPGFWNLDSLTDCTWGNPGQLDSIYHWSLRLPEKSGYFLLWFNKYCDYFCRWGAQGRKIFLQSS